jgi:hypothetical protein
MPYWSGHRRRVGRRRGEAGHRGRGAEALEEAKTAGLALGNNMDVASTLSLSACRHILKPDGLYVVIGHDHYGQKGRRTVGGIPFLMYLMLRARLACSSVVLRKLC